MGKIEDNIKWKKGLKASSRKKNPFSLKKLYFKKCTRDNENSHSATEIFIKCISSCQTALTKHTEGYPNGPSYARIYQPNRLARLEIPRLYYFLFLE